MENDPAEQAPDLVQSLLDNFADAVRAERERRAPAPGRHDAFFIGVHGGAHNELGPTRGCRGAPALKLGEPDRALVAHFLRAVGTHASLLSSNARYREVLTSAAEVLA